MSTIPFWKKIYQTVSGYSESVTDDIIAEILHLSKKELLKTLTIYKPYTKESFEQWTNSSLNSYLKEFVHELSKTLNLDVEIAYSIMCNYLMFEYYGKIKEFWQVTKIGTTLRLKGTILHFYTAERMFLLKTIRHIFEFANDETHPFYTQYREFVKDVKIDDLQENLITVYENLMNEITTENTDWLEKEINNRICRNYREQTEVLMILILTFKENKLKKSLLVKIFKLFVQYNFSTRPYFIDNSKLIDQKDAHDLLSAVVGCYIALLESYWEPDVKDFWDDSAIKDLDISLTNIKVHSGLGLVVLFWILFKTTTSDLETADISFYFNSESFTLLYSVVSNEIFKNCKVGDILKKSCHKIIDTLCLTFCDPKMLFEQKSIVLVISEFLKQKDLVEECLATRNKIDRILEIALDAFPYDFCSFSQVAQSLLQSPSQYESIMNLLNNMPSFLSNHPWSLEKRDVSTLQKSRLFNENSDDQFILPSNSNITIRCFNIYGRDLIQYRKNYNYFEYLEHLVNCMMDNGLRYHRFDDLLLENVVTGYKVVLEAIKNYPKNFNTNEIPTNSLEKVINKITNILPLLNGTLLHFKLVEAYFKVTMAMMIYRKKNFFQSCPSVIWKLFFPKIRIDCLEWKIEELLFNQVMFEETILVKFFTEEDLKDDHELVVTYTEMISTIVEMKYQEHYFQFSNIAYIMNIIFLQHQRWVYKNDSQKNQITNSCLNIFHHILNQDYQKLNSDDERKIFQFCQSGLLNNIYIIETFTRLFIKEKFHLIYIMERESNWAKGPSLKKLNCIQMQLSLLLLIMKQRQPNIDYLLNNKLGNLVKPIASYFTNSYSSVIAELSCRFLERLAQDRTVPLLALLELDHYQIQALFLERLRDPLEEENVKLAIIDLINTCVKTQNGMTAAFFNLKCFMYWDGMEKDMMQGDTVSDFMVDYLQNLKKSHDYFKNPLQLGILTLFHNIWLYHRENLINNIKDLKDFWPIMIDPFLYDFTQNPEIYTVILRIINLEIVSNLNEIETNKVEPKLLETIKKFITDKKQLNRWLEFLLKHCGNIDKNDESKPSSPTTTQCDLLIAWIEFLIVTKKVLSESYTDDIKSNILINCIDGLLNPQPVVTSKLTFSWAQLYLILIQSWTVQLFTAKQKSLIMKKLTKFCNGLVSVYKYFPVNMKEIILCGLKRTIEDISRDKTDDHDIDLLNILHPLGTIIDIEYDHLSEMFWRNNENETSPIKRSELLKPWLICIQICNSLLQLNISHEELSLWYNYRRILKRVFESTLQMLRFESTLPFAKLTIQHLIYYAESPLAQAQDFLHFGLVNFYCGIHPPSLQFNMSDAIMHGIPGCLREWWLIYSMLLILNRTLLTKLDGLILDSCFEFTYLHKETLKEILDLTKSTVNMAALSLVSETLKFLTILFSWQQESFSKSFDIYCVLLDGIKTTINACTSSLLGNKKINFYTITPESGNKLEIINNVPADLVTAILNKLVEILHWGLSCLKNTKPSLSKLMRVYVGPENVHLLIENEFRVPRFDLPINSELTYGKLLCLANYLCKALNQLSRHTPTSTPTPRSKQTLPNTSSLMQNENSTKKSLKLIFGNSLTTFQEYIGFMVYLENDDYTISEKLTSFLHYDTSESISGSAHALSVLNSQLVQNTLEVLMTLLSIEITFNILYLDPNSLYLYKRELCSELQFFYEFVRKRTSEFYNSMISGNTRQSMNFSNDLDVIQKYMIMRKNQDQLSDVVDNNFVLVISQLLIKFCQLSD